MEALRKWSSEGIADVQEGDIPAVIARLRRDYQEAVGKSKAAVTAFLKEHSLRAEQARKLSNFISDPTRERKTTFVCSWIRKSAESASMWSLYGDQGHGVAIRSKIGRLEKCYWRLPIDLSGIYGRAHITALVLRKVVYLGFDDDDRLPDLDDLHLALLKRNHFEDEHEIRIVAFSSDSLERPGFPLHCNLRDIITEIVVGPHAEFEEARARIEEAAADLRGIEVRQSRTSPQNVRR